MEFKEGDITAVHGFVEMAERLLEEKDLEIEGLKQRLHYLKDQRDDLNDDLIETVSIVCSQKIVIKGVGIEKTSWGNLETAAYWKKQYESVAKEFNTIEDRNEELVRIILDNDIQLECKDGRKGQKV